MKNEKVIKLLQDSLLKDPDNFIGRYTCVYNIPGFNRREFDEHDIGDIEDVLHFIDYCSYARFYIIAISEVVRNDDSAAVEIDIDKFCTLMTLLSYIKICNIFGIKAEFKYNNAKSGIMLLLTHNKEDKTDDSIS